MGFAAASAYLLSTIDERRSQHDLGRLDRMELLLKELGDPQRAFPTIHVGGTSGKGSTSTMIASALTASGLKCGLHTKPHLSSMTERMRIDHRVIYEDRFAVLLSLIRPVLDEMALTDLRPTYFETLLALALVHFAEEKVDVAVIEVGLGGRLDGTNLISPAVSVITNVGLDHQDVLGDTVELIAADKAGIAKPGVPLISDAVGAARTVIESICRDVGAPFISVADTVRIQSLSETAQGQHFTVATPNADYDIGTHVVGTFQQRNAATAIVALEHLPSGLRPGKNDIEDGFTNLVLAGRMEVLIAHPSVIFDVAHNPDKIRSLVQSLLQLFPDRRFHFVIAISDTKDIVGIMAELEKMPASFVFTSFVGPGRTAVRPDRLATYLEGTGAWVRVIEDPVEAFSVARRSAATDDVVVVTGSTVIVGIIRAWWVANMMPSA